MDVVAPPTDAEGGLSSETNDNSAGILLEYGAAHAPPMTIGASAGRDGRVNAPVPVTLPEAEITQSGDTPVVCVG